MERTEEWWVVESLMESKWTFVNGTPIKGEIVTSEQNFTFEQQKSPWFMPKQDDNYGLIQVGVEMTLDEGGQKKFSGSVKKFRLSQVIGWCMWKKAKVVAGVFGSEPDM